MLPGKRSEPLQEPLNDSSSSDAVVMKAAKMHTTVQTRSNLTSPASLSPSYQLQDVRDMFQQAFCERNPIIIPTADGSNSGFAELLMEPFPCGILPHFIAGTDSGQLSFTDHLRTELLGQRFRDKDNDLYKFQQTNELKDSKSPCIQTLKHILYVNFLPWLSYVTGITLYDDVNMMCSKYNHTDMLLCHDDQLEGRRVAFIYYLVGTEWCKEDGGTLDLFATDHSNGDPSEVSRSLVPQHNSLVFFPVSSNSFHQVSEVVSEDKCRLSVAGWFHGPPLKVPPSPVTRLPHITTSLGPPGMVEEQVIYDWVNPMYLDPSVQAEIRGKFTEDSEIALPHFFKDNVYERLSSAFASNIGNSDSSKLKWIKKGPPNKRCTEVLERGEDREDVMSQCISIFTSEAMCVILSDLTGVPLHPASATTAATFNTSSTECSSSVPQECSSSEAENVSAVSDAKCSCACEVRRWSPGCYTLLYDTAPADDCSTAAQGRRTCGNTEDGGNDDDAGNHFLLDTYFYINADDWKAEHGGYVSYIDKDDNEELVRVCPSSNTLSLAYSDKDTLKFIKYINTLAKDTSIYCDIYCAYHE